MILWKNPPPLHSLCVSLDKVDLTVDEEKKRRQHFSACVVGIKEEDIPRLLWYTKSIFWITFSRIWSWFVFLLKVTKFASVVLCGRIPIHSVPERNILQRRLEDEKKNMEWDHRERDSCLSPAAFVNQVQYSNILEGRFKQLQGKS